MGTTKDFCPECEEMTTRRIEQRVENRTFRGEAMTLAVDVAVCNSCGRDILEPALDDVMLNRVYDEYRRRHGIITSTEIAQLVEQCGMSQRAFGRILGIGEITVHRYLHGQIPDGIHNTMLRALQDGVIRHRFLAAQHDQLDAADARKVCKLIAQGSDNVANTEINDGIQRLMQKYEADERGNRDFDLQRFCHVALYFLQGQTQSRVQILKDLFYADFLAYKRFLRSLTGAPYWRYQHGPVPVHYARLFGELEDSGAIVVETSEYLAQGEWRTRYDHSALMNFDASLFMPEELAVLETVNEEIASMNATQARARSHEEQAWLKTPDRQVISYQEWARVLSLD